MEEAALSERAAVVALTSRHKDGATGTTLGGSRDAARRKGRRKSSPICTSTDGGGSAWPARESSALEWDKGTGRQIDGSPTKWYQLGTNKLSADPLNRPSLLRLRRRIVFE